MMLSTRVKVARILSIFVVSTLLLAVSLIRIFNFDDGYGNHLIGSVMAILFVVLVCCAMEMCWKPFGTESPNSNTSGHDDAGVSPNTNMDLPLVYSEAPPAYDEVVGSRQQESNFSNVPGTGNSGDLGATGRSSAKTTNRYLFDEGDDAVGDPSASPRDVSVRVETNDDDFEEIYVPRRHSPFFSEGSPIPSSYSPSNELQLSVDCLPTYEEAVTVLQSEGRPSSGSSPSQEDGNLILFI